MTQEKIDPIFTFETSDPRVVLISLSQTGKDITNGDTSALEDMAENIDQSLRGAGYMYDININTEEGTVTITPFEHIESFNQEVFDLIAEELQFTDNLLRGDSEEDTEDAE
jgi:hypothetical protein